MIRMSLLVCASDLAAKGIASTVGSTGIIYSGSRALALTLAPCHFVHIHQFPLQYNMRRSCGYPWALNTTDDPWASREGQNVGSGRPQFGSVQRKKRCLRPHGYVSKLMPTVQYSTRNRMESSASYNYGSSSKVTLCCTCTASTRGRRRLNARQRKVRSDLLSTVRVVVIVLFSIHLTHASPALSLMALEA